MSRRRALAPAGAVLSSLVVLLTACSRREAAPATSTEAHRIVSLAPSTTESLFEIGAGDRVVGRSRYCDWPDAAARVPSVGGLEPDVEAILELRPDLVVGPMSGASERLAERLNARGVATWFANADSMHAIDDLLLGLGERAGHASDARRFVAELDARERAIAQAVAAEAHPRVLMVVGDGPVVAAGPQSYADELLRDAGGVNAVVAGPAWPKLGFEQIVELDPDVVIDSSSGPDGPPRVTPGAPGWSGVRAVREGHVIPLSDTRVLRPGPRIGEGLAVLAHLLHPNVAIP
jgi:iron complex transport system substrate-binding protein